MSSLPQSVPRLGLDSFRMCVSKLFFVGKQRKIFKKISKNRKYFYSAKYLALADSLLNDGFILPSNFDYKELSKKFDIPNNLLQLIDNNQNAFLALKIVEIIGEDEPHQLDPETIYFITNLLNKMNLKKIRNMVFNSALPLRA